MGQPWKWAAKQVCMSSSSTTLASLVEQAIPAWHAVVEVGNAVHARAEGARVE